MSTINLRLDARNQATRIGLPLLFLLSVQFVSMPAYSQNNLFQPLPPEAELTSDQEERIAQIQSRPTTADVQLVQVDLTQLGQDTVELNLSPTREYTASSERIETRGGNNFTWRGELTDIPGNAILVVRDGNVTGTIRAGDEVYSLEPAGQNVTAIILANQEALPPEHPEDFTETEQRSNTEQKLNLLEDQQARELRESKTYAPLIEVLVAYTARVLQNRPDVEALIQLLVEETNDTYANSGVSPRLHLAHLYETQTVEGPSWDQDLNDFRGNGDGRFDKVHSLRDQHAADVAILLFDQSSFCGEASDILATADTAFAVVYWPCGALGRFTFGHEIGHLQGARHNPENDPSTLPFPYGHGFQHPRTSPTPADGFRTAMAYPCRPPRQPCDPRIGHWSNPGIQYQGVATGTAHTHNNARVLNETADLIAAFRPVVTPDVATAQAQTLGDPGQPPARTADVATAQAQTLGDPGQPPARSLGDPGQPPARTADVADVPSPVCRPGYGQQGFWLCMTGTRGPQSFANAVLDCMDSGGRVANYHDWRYRTFRGDGLPAPVEWWLGPITADNSALFVNSSNIGDFDGETSRFGSRNYACAHDLSR